MKIKIFYHVSAYPGWQDLIQEKVELMSRVGLWQRAHTVRFQLHYPGADFSWIENHFANDPKVQLWHCPDSRSPVGETYSIVDLREQSLIDPEPAVILLYHTKGITHRGKPTQAISDAWVEYLDYWNIENWKLAYNLLVNAKYDTVGCNWQWNWHKPTEGGHYSGNIWWTTAEFVKRTKQLQKPHEVNFEKQLNGFSPRHDAEVWISTGQPNHVTLHQFQHAIVYHVDPPRPEDYRLDRI